MSLSRGRAARVRGTGSRSIPHRLNRSEAELFSLAQSHGYLTTDARLGWRRERQGSPLWNIWRMWCDAHASPAAAVVRNGENWEVWVDLAVLRGERVGDLVKEFGQEWVEEGESIEEVDGKVATWELMEWWWKRKVEGKREARELAEMLTKGIQKGNTKRRKKLKAIHEETG